MRLRWIALLGLWLAGGAGAAGTDEAAERQRIQRERQEVEVRHQQALAACGERFVVTACTEAARDERRQGLERLAREQTVLDDDLRKRRAAERLRRIQDKQRDADRRALEPPRPASAAGRGAGLPAARLVTRSPRPGTAAAAEAAAHREAHAERLQKVAEHRQAVERRNAERAARTPRAAPLPPPPAASR